jgi:hypothetical protein
MAIVYQCSMKEALDQIDEIRDRAANEGYASTRFARDFMFFPWNGGGRVVLLTTTKYFGDSRALDGPNR